MKLEIVIPFYNEEACILETFQRLLLVKDILANRYEVSFIFVNDGSKDKTINLLSEIKQSRDDVRVIDLSRNFGHQIALTAGLDFASADYVAVLDGDMQDPPELLPMMLDVAQSGFDVVYGQRNTREGETWFKLLSAKIFYQLLSKLCEVQIPKDTGDFRVMNKKVLESLKSMRERHRFIRGLVPYSGFRQIAFKYDRKERFAGTTKYPLKKMIRFALDAIFSFSTRPLKFIRYLGLVSLIISAYLLFKIAYLKFVDGGVVPGYSSLVVILVFFSSMQILSISILGEYIGRIFEESKQRPLYFINRIL